MFIIIGPLLITLLAIVLFLLFRHEGEAAKKAIPHAEIKEFWDGRERRRYVRFKKSLDVTYALDKRPLSNNCKTVDISRGGMRLLLGEKLAKGTTLVLRVALPHSTKAAEVRGSVAWSSEAQELGASDRRLFCSGIEFFDAKGRSIEEILSYIRSLGECSEA